LCGSVLLDITLDMHHVLDGFQCPEHKRNATRLIELDTLHTPSSINSSNGGARGTSRGLGPP
jgi:hypothetical protein